MKPYHSAIYGGWGIESRHEDELVPAGTFRTEDDAEQFILWCDENDVDESKLETALALMPRLDVVVMRTTALMRLVADEEAKRCVDCGDLDCPADPGH